MANKSVINLYNCNLCKVWMKRDETVILQHFNDYHQDAGQGRSSCPLCQKTFSRKWTVRRHIQRIHKKIIYGELPPPTLTIPRPNRRKTLANLWPNSYKPSSIIIRVLYANNSPYPSNLQKSTSHPPRTVSLL